MNRRLRAGLASAMLALAVALPAAARADNPMGYRLLPADQAATLPRNHGALGLDVERAQEISSAGMAFELFRVKSARRGSSAAAAGLKPGDQIVALNGLVFPSIAAFAAYVGAMQPGSQASIDYIPSGGGPAQAQRVALTVGGPGAPAPASHGLSTGAKVAIGVGALLGCYELGCFSHKSAPAQGAQPYPQGGPQVR